MMYVQNSSSAIYLNFDFCPGLRCYDKYFAEFLGEFTKN